MKRLKLAIGIFLYFIVGYFVVSRLPKYTILSGETFLDGIIPFVPWFVIFYLLAYLYILLPLFVIEDFKAFFKVAKMYVLILTVSFLLFLLVPIEMEKMVIGDGFWFGIVQFIHTFDTSFNNYPSIHVSLSLFSFLVIQEYTDAQLLFFILLLFIIASTLLIKQHLVIDVIGGVVVGAAGYYIHKRT